MTKPWLVKVGVLFIKKRGCIVLTHPQPIKTIHELRRFLRLLLLNINYLRYKFFIKPMHKKTWILNTLSIGPWHIALPEWR